MNTSEHVEVRRRPRRTAQAYRDHDKTVVVLPDRVSEAAEERWVKALVGRLADKNRWRESDDALLVRARDLSRRYLGGLAEPSSVRWAPNQRHRWGSCNTERESIRLSARLKGMPAWVVDYVLIHEMVHLLVGTCHGRQFWDLVTHYPKADRAHGFLEGVTHMEAGE